MSRSKLWRLRWHFNCLFIIRENIRESHISNNRNQAGGGVKRTHRIAVIGAGITGLSAAYRLLGLGAERGLPLDVTVLEGKKRAGGVILTRHAGGFLAEEGPDSFIRSKPEALVAKIMETASAYAGLRLAGNTYGGTGVLGYVHSGEAAAEEIFSFIVRRRARDEGIEPRGRA